MTHETSSVGESASLGEAAARMPLDASTAHSGQAGEASAAPHIDHHNNFNLIRLVAALQVLVVHVFNHFGYHSPLVDAFKVVPGVPTFFFISGSLIYISYKRTKARGLRAFFTNRILRIYPALWTCIFAATVSVVLTGYYFSHQPTIGHFVFWLFAQGSILQFYNPDFMRAYGAGVLNGALWTISVELQFYILTPLLYILLHKKPVLFGLLAATSLALNLYLRLEMNWELMAMKLAYVSFLSWVFMYMTGMLAAEYSKLQNVAKRIPYTVLLVALVLSQNYVGTYIENASNGINPISFIIVAALVTKFSTQRIPIFVGAQRFIERNDFSYGLYLYHMPVINFLLFEGLLSRFGNALAVLPIAGTAAAISWYVIERPALRRKR